MGNSNTVDRSMLSTGDHIYSYRNAHLDSHHGIHVGDNSVIHYICESQSKKGCENCGYNPRRQRGVVKTCLDCFLKGHTLYRQPVIVVRRATKLLNDSKNGLGARHHAMFEDKCVCFAVFCKTGSSASAQAVANNSFSIEMSLDALRALQELESVISVLFSQQNNYFPSTSSAADGMTNVGSTYNPIGDTGGAVSSGHAVAAVSNYEVAGGMNDVAGGQYDEFGDYADGGDEDYYDDDGDADCYLDDW
ncbi:hypothetical protein TIFTF001_013421 [Ficus carica]|uniref:LRAT domain-containing protein n=1 Tax=Ficus carica TaxID=3494 RepID=A0AA88A3H2_FICCA|nr:hypothetical protein TIFTF001_013421 [Ficus carica]